MSRFIEKLHLKNLLSFQDCEIELGDLNVLIGANGSGKSNLVETIGLLRSLPTSLAAYLQQGGGARAWMWNGREPANEAQVRGWFSIRSLPTQLDYLIRFEGGSRLLILEEELSRSDAGLAVRRQSQRFEVLRGGGTNMEVPADASVLATYKSPSDPSSMTQLGASLQTIRVYRQFDTGKRGNLRQGFLGQDGDLLDEAGQNLAMVLHEFDFRDKLEPVNQLLTQLSASFQKIKPRQENGAWTVRLFEEGLLDPVPPQRVSDGTLKFLCLAAVLLDPDPPPLVCIEEPETGLHPDAIRAVGRLLRDAAERMQLVVTTHSPELIDEFTATPDTAIVCEKNDANATELKRLDPTKLKDWLADYALGELWTKGEIGGNRW